LWLIFCIITTKREKVVPSKNNQKRSSNWILFELNWIVLMNHLRNFVLTFLFVCISVAMSKKQKLFHSDLDKAWTTPKKEGETIPSVVFKTRTRIDSSDENPFDWKDLTTEDLFKGKRIVFFSLPGAFTVSTVERRDVILVDLWLYL
jgi:hypothetical protein